MSLNRRDFLKVTGIQAGALAAGARGVDALLREEEAERDEAAGGPALGKDRPEIVVVGAGAFGLWAAWNLQKMGTSVTLVDQYGPGNSRATSGGETRGIRTAYGERELWTEWASEAIRRWNRFGEEWEERHGLELFFTTGDVILREDWEPFLENTSKTWKKVGVRHEVLEPEEVRYRWPQIDVDEVGVALYEYDAGVARARRICEILASEFEEMGGRIRIARAAPGRRFGGRLVDVELEPGGRLEANRFIFALGPWFGKVFPEVMGNRIRTPLGYTFYYGIPAGENRFRHPNMPSYNVPGVTGWPALTVDSRGFRVRTGGSAPIDPDDSVRYIEPEFLERPREILDTYFPALKDAPLVETRACHYESTPNRSWLVDTHPEMENVWLVGGGNAEGCKFGPLLGEYMAHRALGDDPHPELAPELRISEETFEAPEG